MPTQKLVKQIESTLREIIDQRHIPIATYRLQFHAGFTFNDALELVSYLDDLGISDLYASPIFLPRTGSTHGYDVADPTRMNPDLGSEEDFDALNAALQKRDMGVLLDIVPNHMGVNDARNGWWLDVLENGPSSDYASYFDIQWHPIKQEMENKVLLPILGDQYGVVLERGELQLHYGSGTFYFTYYETVLPLTPRTYIPILRLMLEAMVQEPGRETESVQDGVVQSGLTLTPPPPNFARLELESIITALGYLPPRTETDPEKLAERAREKEIVKRRLDLLHSENEEVRAALEAVVAAINGTVGKARSFDLLDGLISEQCYRLAFWRVAGEEINYRRFFDINELAAIRVEEPQVFAATHALAFRILAEGKARGLRIDHPDGLYDPVGYFCRLQQQYVMVKLQEKVQDEFGADTEQLAATLDGWLDRQRQQAEGAIWPLYVVAEKILSESEPLPPDWTVSGTTGYDFLAAANGIFVETRNERAFTRLYNRFSGERTSLRELAFATKMMIMRDSLAGEITTLAHDLERIGERNRHYRDFTLGGLRTALREVISALSIYRTYIDAHNGDHTTVSERDRDFVQAAVREAKRRHPLLDDTLFDYIRDTLLLRNMIRFAEEDRPRVATWVMKFQQLTGPVMAKGVEDTAFYRYNRLVSLNEVGDHPAQFGITVERFHEENSRRAQLWPHSMLATSTHDNKRSEDVRARLNVLSEMPDVWQTSLRNWSRVNAAKKRELDGQPAPDANDEYLFYQIVLGTWPLAEPDAQIAAQNVTPESAWGFLLKPGDSEEYQEFRRRISAYMLKAAKEAKVYTSWLNPYQEYEDAMTRFVDRVLQPGPRNRFLNDLAALARQIAYFGHFNSLAQTLLKLTAPGLPDIYQGNELWDFSLVDPDNRRPVDYTRRAALLKEVKATTKRTTKHTAKTQAKKRIQFANELTEQWQDGRIKLFVTQAALNFRREHTDLFAQGEYIALDVVGERSQHLCAYMRRDNTGQDTPGQQTTGQQAIIVVPRLVATLTDRAERPPIGAELWGDTAIILPSSANGASSADEPAESDGEHSYCNLFTDEQFFTVKRSGKDALQVGEILGNFPVALLTKTPEVKTVRLQSNAP